MSLRDTPARTAVSRTRAGHSRRGGVPIGCVFFIAVPVVLLVGAMLWYDNTSVTIRGEVVWKQETVKLFSTTPMADDPFTRRTLLLHVRYTPPDSPMITQGVKAPADRYDRTHVGDVVSLRYLKAWPRITAGLAERTMADHLRDARSVLAERANTWYLWVSAGILIVMLCAKIGGWPMLIIAFAYVACSVPLFFADRGPLPVPAVAATAVVGETVRVDKTPRWGSDELSLDARDLTQSYESIELTYVPRPGRDSVRAVDAIDAGSAGALATGALVAIRYDPAHPRAAQLAHGTRTFRSRNRFALWPETLAPGLLGVLGLLVRPIIRRRANAPKA